MGGEEQEAFLCWGSVVYSRFEVKFNGCFLREISPSPPTPLPRNSE